MSNRNTHAHTSPHSQLKRTLCNCMQAFIASVTLTQPSSPRSLSDVKHCHTVAHTNTHQHSVERTAHPTTTRCDPRRTLSLTSNTPHHTHLSSPNSASECKPSAPQPHSQHPWRQCCSLLTRIITRITGHSHNHQTSNIKTTNTHDVSTTYTLTHTPHLM